jgi:hypothetical protein
MTYTELVEIDLTDDERSFMQTALNEWGGPASYAPLPITILGLTSWDEFDNLVTGYPPPLVVRHPCRILIGRAPCF